jgi:hypothetical protein
MATSTSPPHWRLAVGQRYSSGSVVHDRPRCLSSGKVGYFSITEAWVAAFVDFGDTPVLKAYPCPDCDAFHLGRTRQPAGHVTIRWARRCFDSALAEMLESVNELRRPRRETS